VSIKISPCHQNKVFPEMRKINIVSAIIKDNPSLNITFLDTLISEAIFEYKTEKITTAGIIIPLKIALPAVVPIPPEKPSVSFKYIRKKIVVNSSGIELAMALIVAPLTPSERFLPRYSDETSNPSLAFHIIMQQKTINNKGIKIPIDDNVFN
jgi:hypothetical protein